MPEFRFREAMSDVEIPASARLVYFWMRTLAAKDGHCYARSSEIAARVGISPTKCSKHITALENAGYISREHAKGLGTGRRRFRMSMFFATLVAAHAIGTAEPASAASGSMLTEQPITIPLSGHDERGGA